MSNSVKLSKKSANYWQHAITINTQTNDINDPHVIMLIANNVLSLSIGNLSHNKTYQDFTIDNIIVQDDSTGGQEEFFTTFNELSTRLSELEYIGFVSRVTI